MRNSLLKRAVSLLICFVLLAGSCLWILWADNAIQTMPVTLKSERLPSGFAGFRIAHISDLHNDPLGDDYATLLALLQEEKPDIIAVTGDLIDCRVPDADISLAFMQKALQIAPVYYVTGNHEAALYAEYPQIENRLKELGVTVLNNEAVTLTSNNSRIILLGLSDPNMQLLDKEGRISLMRSYAQNNYTIVLSHRPELFKEYVAAGADLVLTGHAHGGQVRLPVVGGLYAPSQGLLPVYDAGAFTENTTVMYVSRGIGNSLFPIRFNNRPELPVFTLQTTALG